MAPALDLDAFDPPRTWSWVLVAPAGRQTQDAGQQAPLFAAPVPELRAAVLAAARAEPRTTLLGESGGQLEFRCRTRFLRFPDLVTVVPLGAGPGRSSLALYSRARYGLYDFGVNRRRARRWLRRIAAALPPG